MASYEMEINATQNANKELNILLLRETGVGKSTFINAFANYLMFDTLEQAKKGKMVCFIPAKFTVTDNNFDEHEVKFGEFGDHSNESQEDGQSATQACKAYVFEFGDFRLRLIDTPGVGNTRGVSQDRLNVDNILHFLSQYENLNAICILLLPNNSRVNVMFEFCIKQLLVHLEKTASKNIIFIFTNARGTFYMPGDTVKPLKKILSGFKDVSIEFNKDTVYCFDNEAFRFLVALKSNRGVKFQEDVEKNFSASWDKSVAESIRLICFIAGDPGLPPHKIQLTLSVNEARRMIVSLSKPLADITEFIQTRQNLLQDRIKDFENAEEDIEKYKQKLTYKDIELKTTEIENPLTVCGHVSCAGVREIVGRKVLLYERKCHNPCTLINVPKDIMGASELLGCWAMNGSNYCRVCEHSYREHLHIYYLSELIEVTREDSIVKNKIATIEQVKECALKYIMEWSKEVEENQREMDFITKATAKFTHYLKANAIAPYNDSFEAYLEHIIENKRVILNGETDTDNAKIVQGLM